MMSHHFTCGLFFVELGTEDDFPSADHSFGTPEMAKFINNGQIKTLGYSL